MRGSFFESQRDDRLQTGMERSEIPGNDSSTKLNPEGVTDGIKKNTDGYEETQIFVILIIYLTQMT